MSLFEFLMVLVSIIIGLGIAEVLTGIARLIQCRALTSGSTTTAPCARSGGWRF